MRSNLKQMQAKTSTESEMKRTQDIMKIDCERASSSMQQQHFRAQMRNDCKNVKKEKNSTRETNSVETSKPNIKIN